MFIRACTIRSGSSIRRACEWQAQMLFRSPTCSNLATVPPLRNRAKAARNILSPAHHNISSCSSSKGTTTTPYIDTTTGSFSRSSNEKDEAPLSVVELPTRLPHVLELLDGRYALTFCEIHPIPEDKECCATTFIVVRCGDAFLC